MRGTGRAVEHRPRPPPRDRSSLGACAAHAKRRVVIGRDSRKQALEDSVVALAIEKYGDPDRNEEDDRLRHLPGPGVRVGPHGPA